MPVVERRHSGQREALGEHDHRRVNPAQGQVCVALDELGDPVEIGALHAERDALIDQLTAATGLSGRARTTGASQERARVATTKAINAAIDRIATVDGPVGRHLQAAIHTG
jgi:hypothetical protein